MAFIALEFTISLSLYRYSMYSTYVAIVNSPKVGISKNRNVLKVGTEKMPENAPDILKILIFGKCLAAVRLKRFQNRNFPNLWMISDLKSKTNSENRKRSDFQRMFHAKFSDFKS